MIDYSICIRPATPGVADAVEMKAYPVAQLSETMTIEQFAEHIASHGSVYSRDIVKGVLSKAVDCLREKVMEGKKVELGDLGAFYVSLKSNGAPTAADISAQSIKEVNVIWQKSFYFQNLRKDAEFRLVASRQAQAEAVAEQKGATPEPTPTPVEKKTVTVAAMPEGYGKVEGNGEFPVGSNAVIRAIPNTGYSFVGWSDGNLSPARTLKLRNDLNLVANFIAGEADPSKFYVTATAKNPDHGTVRGSGAYKDGDLVTLTAEPAAHYMFAQWTNGSQTSSENPMTFNVHASANWVAEFVEGVDPPPLPPPVRREGE